MLEKNWKNAIPYESEKEWIICRVGCGEKADRRMSVVIIFMHLISHWVERSYIFLSNSQVVKIELMSRNCGESQAQCKKEFLTVRAA